ncbi:MAG: hypothetical protein HY731_11225 [Candidatus Tectomicrobia bacterium]|nr:hypothetical protein [Candidatus Tectomicrobia bacterium]
MYLAPAQGPAALRSCTNRRCLLLEENAVENPLHDITLIKIGKPVADDVVGRKPPQKPVGLKIFQEKVTDTLLLPSRWLVAKQAVVRGSERAAGDGGIRARVSGHSTPGFTFSLARV